MTFPALWTRALPLNQHGPIRGSWVRLLAVRAIVGPGSRVALTPRHVALAGVAVTIAALASCLVIWAKQGFVPPRASAMAGPAALGAEAVLALAYTAVGYLLAARQSRNAIGWLFLAVGVSGAITLPGNFLVAGLHDSVRVPPFETLAWAWAASSFHLPVVGALMISVILLFPDGRPRSRLAASALPLAVAGAAIIAAGLAVDPNGLLWFPALPNPFAMARSTAAPVVSLRVVGLGLMLVALTIATTSMVLRYRSAPSTQRHALRWMACAMTLLAVSGAPFLVMRYGVRTSPGTGEAMLVGTIVAATLLPAAAAIGVMRHRLFDIDLILNRTLVYVPLMAILSGLYAGSVALFQRVFVAVTGDTSDVAIVITTLVLASAFTPIRKALEELAERRWKPEHPRRRRCRLAHRTPRSRATTCRWLPMSAMPRHRTADSSSVWQRSRRASSPSSGAARNGRELEP
jgi:hypothetical protein